MKATPTIRRRFALLGILALALLRVAPVHAGTPLLDEYRPGEGLTLGRELWIAGDLTFAGDIREDGPSSVEIDDVTLLARWEPVQRFALFTELRLQDLAQVVEGEGPNTGVVEFRIERLYAEAFLTPHLTLRLGKVLTPFGLWNPIHRAPLTWSVEEPAITNEVFPRHATGVSLLHRTTWNGSSVDATLYGPVQDEPTFRPSDEKGWLVGGRLAAGRSVGGFFATVGLNAAAFRPYRHAPWTTASGLDLEVSVTRHQIMSELTFQVPTDGGRVVHGFYLQDAISLAPLAPDVFGVLRAEYIQPEKGGAAVGGLVGVFWRPVPWLVLRTEYVLGNRTLSNFNPGFHAALSLLF